MKIVNKGEFVLLFDEDKKKEINCVAYLKGSHMNQEDIADQLGFTKGAVSQIVKRSLHKIYKNVEKKNKHLNPLEIVLVISELFDVKTRIQFNKFYRSFPKPIKKQVEEEATKNGYYDPEFIHRQHSMLSYGGKREGKYNDDIREILEPDESINELNFILMTT